MTTPDQAAAERPLNEFAALVSVALTELGEVRVLASADHGPFVYKVAPGHEVATFDDAAVLFNELAASDRPCLVIPPWGYPRDGDYMWPDAGVIEKPLGIIVPESDLGHRLPRRTGHLGTPHLVVVARAQSPEIHRAFRVALVVIDPTDTDTTTITRFFNTPDTSEVPLNESVSDLERLLRQQGGTTKFGLVYRGASLAGQPLRPEDHDPKLKARVADLAGFGEGAVVGDVFEVLRGRPLPPDRPWPAAGSNPDIRVIRGRDVTLAGELLPEDEDADEPRPRRFVHVPLQVGDLVMREVEQSGRVGLPVEIAAGDSPLAAGNGLVVLRPRVPLEREEFEFYKLFLGSQRSRDVMRASTLGSALRLSGLQRAPLPRPDADLLGALRDIRRAQEALRAWASEGVGLTSAAFSEPAAEARRTLIETGRQLRQRVEAAQQVGSLEHRIANFYPYPIAHKWRIARVAEGAGDNAKTYGAILDCFEATMAFGAAIALAFAHANSVEVPAMKEVRRKLSNGSHGTSLGDWVNILKGVSSGKAFKNLDPDAPLASIRQLLPEGTKIAKAQERLSKRRNDESHQRRVDPIDLPEAIEAARTDLELILDHAGFLADLPAYQIKSARWDSIERRGEVVAQALRGDHPIAPSVVLQHDESGIETDSLYVKDITGPLVLLRPFLVRHECPQCRTWSTFHPDRRDDGELLLKAVDHSHTISGAQHEPALRSVGYLEEN